MLSAGVPSEEKSKQRTLTGKGMAVHVNRVVLWQRDRRVRKTFVDTVYATFCSDGLCCAAAWLKASNTERKEAEESTRPSALPDCR